MINNNNKTLHPALKFVILLIVYSLGYMAGKADKQLTTTEAVYGSSYNEVAKTDAPKDETLKYTVQYDISYPELNEREKELYSKILSVAMKEDGTFITDRELKFKFNENISESEGIRVRKVLYNNFPDVTFYTTKYDSAWIYYETYHINGFPLYKTYYFNVKYN